MSFTALQEKRRSIYALGKNVSQSSEELFQLVVNTVKAAPTAFNNQSVRAVVLTGEAHDKLWQLTADRLKQEVPSEEAYQKTLDKINNAFRSGYGTVLFFTDTDIVKASEESAPLYAANFYDWSEQGQGIAEYATWLAFADAGLGASLQHYNPLIDEQVAKAFDIPSSWRLRAEMPFGSIEAPAGDKTFVDDSERFKFFEN